MKNLLKLGRSLGRNEQKEIQGGSPPFTIFENPTNCFETLEACNNFCVEPNRACLSTPSVCGNTSPYRCFANVNPRR